MYIFTASRFPFAFRFSPPSPSSFCSSGSPPWCVWISPSRFSCEAPDPFIRCGFPPLSFKRAVHRFTFPFSCPTSSSFFRPKPVCPSTFFRFWFSEGQSPASLFPSNRKFPTTEYATRRKPFHPNYRNSSSSFFLQAAYPVRFWPSSSVHFAFSTPVLAPFEIIRYRI